MNQKTFSPLYTGRLTVEEVYSLTKSTIDMSKPVAGEFSSVLKAAFEQLENASLDLGANLNKSQKLTLTAEMKPLEEARDTDIKEIFRVTRSYLNSRDAAKKTAASLLQLFIAPYKGVYRQPIDVESAVIHELTTKYKASPELQAAAAAIGIAGTFASLETDNAAFDRLYNERTAEKASRGASASSLKSKTLSGYTQYSSALEQALAFTPSATLTALFNQLDELRKQYRPLESGKK